MLNIILNIIILIAVLTILYVIVTGNIHLPSKHHKEKSNDHHDGEDSNHKERDESAKSVLANEKLGDYRDENYYGHNYGREFGPNTYGNTYFSNPTDYGMFGMPTWHPEPVNMWPAVVPQLGVSTPINHITALITKTGDKGKNDNMIYKGSANNNAIRMSAVALQKDVDIKKILPSAKTNSMTAKEYIAKNTAAKKESQKNEDELVKNENVLKKKENVLVNKEDELVKNKDVIVNKGGSGSEGVTKLGLKIFGVHNIGLFNKKKTDNDTEAVDKGKLKKTNDDEESD